ncbi:MAG TPA: hypothetical protein VGR52_06855 [Stellaceae bacterium]|nr:hypothetical protein [Stellaceae bacterium]
MKTMKADAHWGHRLFLRRRFDDDTEGDVVLRNFVVDLIIFVGEALLSAACLRIAAADGNMTFLMLGILAATAAALPLRDWLRG